MGKGRDKRKKTKRRQYGQKKRRGVVDKAQSNNRGQHQSKKERVHDTPEGEQDGALSGVHILRRNDGGGVPLQNQGKSIDASS